MVTIKTFFVQYYLFLLFILWTMLYSGIVLFVHEKIFSAHFRPRK